MEFSVGQNTVGYVKGYRHSIFDGALGTQHRFE